MPGPAQGEGCQIVLVDHRGAVLLQLRDDKDWIPYPGMWAVPGGMLEAGERPSTASSVRSAKSSGSLSTLTR